MNNTKVYVSHLPDDLTEQQFVDLMQKCGLVLKDPESGDYKVKLYKDEQGNFKGDALCTYIKVESVDLALQILDGACVGPRSTERITVERAKFQMRGEYNAALKPKKKKKKLLDKIQKKQEKLFSWHPEPLRGQRGKHENVIIIRNAFEPSEFDDHAEKILNHTESLRAQCSSFGTVKKLELFDRHSQGVVKVVFSDVEAADMCITSMNNRLYNKRKLTVGVWDGVEGFKVEETPEERAARIKKWDEFLMKGGDTKGADNRSKAANKDTEDSKVEDTTSEETAMDSELSEEDSEEDFEVTFKERETDSAVSEEDSKVVDEVESNTALETSEDDFKDSTAGEGSSKEAETDSKLPEKESKVQASTTIETDEDNFRAITAVEDASKDTKTDSEVPEKESEADASIAMETNEDSFKDDTSGSDDEGADISHEREDKKIEGSKGGGGAEEA